MVIMPAHKLAVMENVNVEKLIRERYGITNYRDEGDELRMSCPLPDGLHKNGDRSPSFGFNKETRLWGCFVDGGGNAAQFVMRMEGVGFDAAIDILRAYQSEITKEDFDRLVESFTKDAQHTELKQNNEAIKWADEHTDYWYTRGYTDLTIKKYKLGYDKLDNRATVPHFFNGVCVGYQKRSLDGSMPKWKNAPDFPKSDTLFNYDNVKNAQEVIVVEAACSAIWLSQNGYNAVATFGAKVTENQIRLLRGFKNVIIYFDPDSAGENGAEKMGNELNKFTSVYIVNADGDPNELPPDQLEIAINEAQPFWG